LTINKANATITISTPNTWTYDGLVHTATGTAKGVNNLTLGGLSFTAGYKNVPGGVQTWNFDGGTNYSSQSGTITVTINKAPVTAKADDKYIYKGDVPVYTATFTGLVNGETPVAPFGTSTYVPASSTAGTYPITPVLNLAVGVPGNYSITATNGTLYVNPKGTGAKAIIAEGECITKLTKDPSGFAYKATFEYYNNNSTKVWVPLGADNQLVSTGGTFSGTPPVVFNQGENFFDVYFDGKKLTWSISSFSGSTKVTNSDYLTSTSRICTILGQAAPVGTMNFIDQTAPMGEVKVLAVYPNPVSSRLVIRSPMAGLTDKDIAVFDIQGKSYPVRGMRVVSAHELELDMTDLHPGMYLLRVRQTEGYKMMRIEKQ